MVSLLNMTNDERKVRYQNARAGFIIQGTTLTQWCRSNDTHIQNVRDAFLGKWNGKNAERLVNRVEFAAVNSPK